MPTNVNADFLLRAFRKAGKRVHVVGSGDAGVIAALDLEGRLFTMLEGEVLNRVNPDAIAGFHGKPVCPAAPGFEGPARGVFFRPPT